MNINLNKYVSKLCFEMKGFSATNNSLGKIVHLSKCQNCAEKLSAIIFSAHSHSYSYTY